MYNSTRSSTIGLDKILLTDHIVTAIRTYGGKLDNTSKKGIRIDAFPLNRMGRMHDAFQKNVRLEPIVIQKHPVHTDYYHVIQGRHRFAMSVVAGYTHISVSYY